MERGKVIRKGICASNHDSEIHSDENGGFSGLISITNQSKIN